MEKAMWIETSKEVYSAIFRHHNKALSAFASYSDTTGTYPLSFGRPQMMTEWGFKNSDASILKIEQIKESETDEEWSTKYFIRFFKNECNCD